MSDLSVDNDRCALLFHMLAGFDEIGLDADHYVNRRLSGGEDDPHSEGLGGHRNILAFLAAGRIDPAVPAIALDALRAISVRAVVDAQAASLRRIGAHDEAVALETQHQSVVDAFRRDIYEQARFKIEWLERLPVEHVAALLMVALDVQKPPKLRPQKLQMMGDFVRRHATFYAELPMPTSFLVAAPAFGTGGTTATEVSGRTAFIATLADAVVRHRSSLIRTENSLLLDAEEDEIADIDLVLHVDPSVMAINEDAVLGMEYGRRLSVPEAVHLGGVPSRVFGHWLCQFLPKYFGARFSGLLPAVPILVDAHMPTSHLEALSYFLDDARTQIVEIPEMTSIQVDRLWILSDWLYVPIAPAPGQDLGPKHLSPPPQQMAVVVRAMLARKPAPARSKIKLFIARHTFRHRKMINHDRIMQIALDLGFRVVFLEEHPFVEQLDLIRSAETIIGPDGSSHMMCMFAQPGTKIAMLSHGFVENNAGLFAIFAALDLDAIMLRGRCVNENRDYPRFSDYEIDEAQFREVATR